MVLMQVHVQEVEKCNDLSQVIKKLFSLSYTSNIMS